VTDLFEFWNRKRDCTICEKARDATTQWLDAVEWCNGIKRSVLCCLSLSNVCSVILHSDYTLIAFFHAESFAISFKSWIQIFIGTSDISNLVYHSHMISWILWYRNLYHGTCGAAGWGGLGARPIIANVLGPVGRVFSWLDPARGLVAVDAAPLPDLWSESLFRITDPNHRSESPIRVIDPSSTGPANRRATDPIADRRQPSAPSHRSGPPWYRFIDYCHKNIKDYIKPAIINPTIGNFRPNLNRVLELKNIYISKFLSSPK
jgi:hypothetical protein